MVYSVIAEEASAAVVGLVQWCRVQGELHSAPARPSSVMLEVFLSFYEGGRADPAAAEVAEAAALVAVDDLVSVVAVVVVEKLVF